MRSSRLLLVVLSAALAAAPAAQAHHRHHGHHPPGWGGGGGGATPSVSVIAQGLNSPRHLAFDWRGNLYVAEAGTGGSDRCFIGGEGPACMGPTGSVTKVDRWGRQSRVVEGLASYANSPSDENPVPFNNAIGPHGITTVGGLVIITNGGPTAPMDPDPARPSPDISRDELAAQFPYANNFGRVLLLRDRGRAPVSLADIWKFERDVNPDKQDGNPAVDSNPDDVLFDGHRLVVSDAGGNALDTVDLRGRVRNLTVFPNVKGVPNPLPPPPDKVDMQAVPTSVVLGPDHQYYVSQLTGFPFPIGAANIWRVDPRTGRATVFASGFTNLMDLAFGADGTLYALEIDHDSLLGPSPDGALYKVDRRGQKQLVALPEGTLTMPGGITAGRDALYVTNNSGSPGGGEVVKIRLR
jgi:sugar lactone lactonase YvrE